MSRLLTAEKGNKLPTNLLNAFREVLLESQSEKIGDLDRELVTAERQCRNHVPQLSNDEEVDSFRKL